MSVTARTLNCIKDFRHAVVDTLKTANLSGIGQNVSASRKMKAWPEEKSFVIVTTPGTDFDDRNTRPRFYFAKTDLYIDVYARSFLQDEENLDNVDSASDLNDFLDDTMNAIVSVVEPCPFWKGPYEGLVSKCVLKSYDTNLAERAETECGFARITFEVSFTVKIDRSAPTKDFLRAKNTLYVDGGNNIKSVLTEADDFAMTEKGDYILTEGDGNGNEFTTNLRTST